MHVSLRIPKAQLTHNNTSHGILSPYVKLETGGFFYQTQIAKEAGQTPTWNDNFDFQLAENGIVNLSVFNTDKSGVDTLLGEAQLNLPFIAATGILSNWHEIFLKKERAGQILIEFKIDQPAKSTFGGAVLIVKPIRADLVHDTKFIGKMNPFCQLIVNGKEYTSAVDQKGSKTPEWTDTFTIPLSGDGAVRLVVWQKDHDNKNELVGDTTLNLFEMQKAGINQQHGIFYKGKNAGIVFLNVTQNGK